MKKLIAVSLIAIVCLITSASVLGSRGSANCGRVIVLRSFPENRDPVIYYGIRSDIVRVKDERASRTPPFVSVLFRGGHGASLCNPSMDDVRELGLPDDPNEVGEIPGLVRLIDGEVSGQPVFSFLDLAIVNLAVVGQIPGKIALQFDHIGEVHVLDNSENRATLGLPEQSS